MTASSKDDIYRDVAEQIERGQPMPWPARPEYRRGPFPREPLKPLYTEKLPTSPHFPSLAEATQRRRDRWSAVVARGGMVMMAGAFLGALWYGPGVVPAGAFVAGLIIFIAVCFVSGNCRRP